MIPWPLKPAPEYERSPSQGSVRFTFLGTAGFTIATPERTLVLDPYLTRAGVLKTAFGRLQPDETRLRRYIPKADDVLVGHSHYDHALDAPALCKQTGARLLGSYATGHLATSYGLDPRQFLEIKAGGTVAAGSCSVTAYRSLHGKALFGRVPFPGDLTGPIAWPPRAHQMKHGPVFHWHLNLGAVTVLHIDSADFYEDDLTQADVLLLCAAGHQYRQNYVQTLVEKVRPKVVLPCHWDDFSTPIEAPPRQLPGVNVEDFVQQIRACGTRAVVLAPLQSWWC